jgi:aspartate/methionine/tyrosine aminotransferase
LKVSKRTQQLGTENAFVVLKDVQDLQATGHDIINFCIGQPDFDTPQHIKDAAHSAIHAGKTGYTESAGITPLRDAIAEHLARTRAIDIPSHAIVVANGAKPFISYTILSTTDYGVGHEVLYPNPGYPIYPSQIQAHGAIPVPYALRERNAYRVDITELTQKINKRTRLLILNFPHNPTGGVLRRRDLEAIAEIVTRYPDLWILSDELYSRLLYDHTFTSMASLPDMQARTIILDGVSKTYAMTGWRIGYAANVQLAPSFARWMTNTDSCPAHPNQYAALAALTGPQDPADQMAASFQRRRDLIVQGLNAIPGIRCHSPGGTFYVWPNVTAVCRHVASHDAETFRQLLLHQAGVAVLADRHFGPKIPGEGEHLRLSYATSEANIREGLRRIKTLVTSHPLARITRA